MLTFPYGGSRGGNAADYKSNSHQYSAYKNKSATCRLILVITVLYLLFHMPNGQIENG